MKHDQKEADVLPAMLPAVEKPDGFLGNVAIPDQEVLGATDIGPPGRKGEKEFSQIMGVFRGYDFTCSIIS